MLGLSFACTSDMQGPICTYICRRWHLKNWLLESFLLWMLCSHLYKSSNQILCHQQSVSLSDMTGWEGFFVQTSFQQKTVFSTNTIFQHNVKYAVGFQLNPSFSHHWQSWLILIDAKHVHALGLQFSLWYYDQGFLWHILAAQWEKCDLLGHCNLWKETLPQITPQRLGGAAEIKVLFLTPLPKALKKSIKERIFSPVYSSESENPNLPHKSASFFQVGTVPGQRSFSEKIIVTNCQKHFFALRST